MKSLRVSVGNFLLVLLVSSLFAACGEQEKKLTHSEIYLYQGPDRDQKVIAKAKQEGSVMIYSSLVPEDLEAISNAFEKKYGIKVNSWRALPEKVAQRAIIESRAERYQFDVLGVNGPDMEAAYRENILERFYSPAFTDLPAEFFPKHKYYVPDRVSLFVVAYNTKLVKPEQLPNSYEDLLHPKWKGGMAIEITGTDWFAAVIQAMGEEKGIKYFKDLAALNPVLRNDHTLLAQMVGSGEIPLVINVYNQSVERLKAKNVPIDWKPLQPAFGRASGIGLSKQAPHPYAALLLVDFILSQEGQEILRDRGRVPVNTKVESPLSKFKYQLVDSTRSQEEGEKWTRLWAEIFLRGKLAQNAEK